MSDESDIDASAPKRRRAAKVDDVSSTAKPKRKSLQSHGQNSIVYVPVILKLFQDRWRPGASTIVFSLDDVRTAVEAVRAASKTPDRISSRNPADVVYRMRSRTKLPAEILEKGFHVLRAVGRGRYQFEKASSGIIEVQVKELTPAIDQTPMPVRRLLPETMAEMDEQALLSVVGYCQLLDHFTGMKICGIHRQRRRRSDCAASVARREHSEPGGLSCAAGMKLPTADGGHRGRKGKLRVLDRHSAP
jgi:hypothetical protein